MTEMKNTNKRTQILKYIRKHARLKIGEIIDNLTRPSKWWK